MNKYDATRNKPAMKKYAFVLRFIFDISFIEALAFKFRCTEVC